MKYDRELYMTTLKAIKKVQDVKEKRESQFYKNRYPCVSVPTRLAATHFSTLPSMIGAPQHVFFWARSKIGGDELWGGGDVCRMSAVKAKRKEEKLKDLKQNIDLIRPAPVKAKEEVKVQQADKMQEGN